MVLTKQQVFSLFPNICVQPAEAAGWGGCGSSAPSLLVGIQKLGVLGVLISLSIYISDLL